MALKFARSGGARSQEATITISMNAKTIFFSSGFFRTFVKETRPTHIRQGYDTETRELGIVFAHEKNNSGEFLKLSYSRSGNSATAVINPVLSEFDDHLNIDLIAGLYRADAIRGPVAISGAEVFLLKIDKRVKRENKLA